MNEQDIKRINELYHKAKEGGGLTPEEAAEQKKLRQAYLNAVRRNLRGSLNNISVVEKDGSVTDLGKKFGAKYKNN